ncbi:MAG: hypothetical protein K8Q89_03375 [Nitrosarchaeum sp.]|nr:hypothetical protein [Nitrosarchaeum sp.]
MVYDDNKGHSYEKLIAGILKARKIRITEPAGSSDATDIEFFHNGKQYNLEMKNDAVGPDWGQVSLRYRKDRWVWTTSKKRKDIIEIYDSLELDGITGVLNFFTAKIMPYMGRVEKIGKKEHDEDFKLLDKYFEIDPSALEIFYADTDYLQVGNGYGFYHIRSDPANLGTEKINAAFKLRLRVKPFHNHHNRCPKCQERYRGSYKTCKKCDLKLSTDTPTICSECGEEVQYSDFIHVYDSYGFFAVLKCESISNKSKLNIEENKEQKFPPIKS